MARGVQKLGGAAKRVGDPDETSPNPIESPANLARPDVRTLEDSVANAEKGAAVDFGADRGAFSSPGIQPDVNLPRSPALYNVPDPPPGPTMAATRSPLLIPPAMRSPDMSAAAVTPPFAPSGAMAPAAVDRSEVPIPALPGQAGGPSAYDPVKAARYDYVMQGARHGEDGSLLTKDHGGGFDRNWKNVAQNLLIGASRAAAANPHDPIGAAIGGAGAGALGTIINPEKGREFTFDSVQGPRMEREQEKARRERQQAGEEALSRAKIDQIITENGLNRARTAATVAGMKDSDLQRRRSEAEIDLFNARAEAARTGKPTYKDIAGPDGKIQTVAVYANGDQIPVGGSGAAAMQRDRIAAQDKRADDRNAAALERTKAHEAGADARTDKTIAGAKERAEIQERGRDARSQRAPGRLTRPGLSNSGTSSGSGLTRKIDPKRYPSGTLNFDY